MKKVAVIGAGISGLFIGNLFKRNKKYQVTIFERNRLINLNEGYGIQLSVNSIKLLNKIQFDKLENNEKFNPDKIYFYSIKNSTKICDLNISDFNTENCKYTTLKRSSLIDFLKKDLEKEIKFNHTISKIEQQDQIVKIAFENNETYEFDYLIISDGVFSKSKNLLLKNQIKPKFNDTLAIRGIIPSSSNIADKKNISLFLGSNFHYVIYPVSPDGDLNFIAVMKFKLSDDEQKDYALFNDDIFINKIIEPLRRKYICKKQIKKGISGLREMLKLYKKGYSVAMMIDQRVSEGIKSNLFNFPALTTTVPAQMIKKFNCKIIPVYTKRIDKFNYEINIEEPLSISSDQTIQEITDNLNLCLENMIKKNPDQWIWSHNRWK